MSKLNFLVFINTYSDAAASNNPSLSNFKWTRSMDGLPAQNPLSEAFSLAPGESKNMFNGTRTLTADGTTRYDIALKPLSSSTYRITVSAGTAANFRTPRAIGIDATTEITTTTNGPIVTFTSTGGTAMSTTAVQIGDMVRIGSLFNVLNQGEFKIIAKTSNSFTIENQIAVNEGPIVLASGFASQISIYSAAGVQKGDTLILSSGFSAVTLGSYKITDVAANYIEFYSTDVLPQETTVTSLDLAIYSAAKNLIYLESDQKVSITVNGSIVSKLEPFVINDSRRPGVFMLKSTVYSLDIQNTSLDTASLFLATIE